MNIKKIALSLTVALLTFSVTTTFAQEDPYKAARKANSLFVGFNSSQNVEKLEAAKEKIDFAISKVDEIVAKKQPTAWLNKGNIYVELAKNEATKTKYENALDDAFEANKMAMNHELAKKFVQTAAAKNLQTVAFEYWNRGAANYELKNYGAAYEDYNKVLVVRELVLPIDKTADPLGGVELDKDGKQIDKYASHIEATAFLATLSGKNEEAAKMFETMLASGKKTSAVYNGLYKSYIKSSEEKALKFLKEGRAAFPEDQELLYSEINYFLKAGKTAELEENLKIAIEKDPENKSLYSVLGNTYDNLIKDAKTDEERATLTGKAKTYYEGALKIDPDYADVVYSLGALYYNEAVRYAKLRSELSLKQKKEYEAYTNEFKANVTKAHPYFVKSEKLNPADRSTIIALKELYAQADRLDITKEYKGRLVQLDANEKITAPFGGHPSTEELFKK
jgi:Tfp pilus assembly protein PilF